MRSSLSTRYVPAREIDGELVAAWRGLADRAAEPNPFQEPDVVLPAIHHLAGRVRVGLITVSAGSRLLATLAVIWPLRLPAEAWWRVPVPALQAWTEPFMQLSTPLVDRDRTEDAVGALVRLPAPVMSRVPLAMRYLGDDGPVSRALDSALTARGQQVIRLKTYERAVMVRDAAAPPSKNKRSRHRKIRNQRDPMAAQLGEVQVQDRSRDPEAVEQFLALEAAGWKGAQGTALASTPATAAWFRDVCSRFRAAGRLELLALTAGDHITAMQCNFRAADWSFHAKSAYAENLAEHRPGMQLLVHNIDEMAGGEIAVRDSVTMADNQLFNQVWSERRTMSTVLIPPPGRAVTTAIHAVGWAHRQRSRIGSGAAGRSEAPARP